MTNKYSWPYQSGGVSVLFTSEHTVADNIGNVCMCQDPIVSVVRLDFLSLSKQLCHCRDSYYVVACNLLQCHIQGFFLTMSQSIFILQISGMLLLY